MNAVEMLGYACSGFLDPLFGFMLCSKTEWSQHLQSKGHSLDRS